MPFTIRLYRRFPVLCILTLAILCAAPVRAGFEEGMTAYDRGDYAATVKEWRPLAEQGNATAQHHLAWLYLLGRGVPQDDQEASRWFLKAAEQGDSDAQTNLGSLYLLGDRIPQDVAEALKWLRAAASQGHPMAQTKLGIMYEDGHGVPQDRVQAYMWFSLAAGEGSELAKAFRDALAKEMTPAQIAQAQQLAQEWTPMKK
ncbi:MAG TPA: tetratricopeptide repeat protein [Nitrospiraceae bacterium]|nr:tetratricopeptide repeat protein [Nitrospiraceae bacterium]